MVMMAVTWVPSHFAAPARQEPGDRAWRIWEAHVVTQRVLVAKSVAFVRPVPITLISRPEYYPSVGR